MLILDNIYDIYCLILPKPLVEGLVLKFPRPAGHRSGREGLLQFHLLMEWQRPLFFDFNNREKEKNPVFPEEIRDFCVHYPDHSQEWL